MKKQMIIISIIFISLLCSGCFNKSATVEDESEDIIIYKPDTLAPVESDTLLLQDTLNATLEDSVILIEPIDTLKVNSVVSSIIDTVTLDTLGTASDILIEDTLSVIDKIPKQMEVIEEEPEVEEIIIEEIPPKDIEYLVKSGDSLWKIAKKQYNDPLMWRLIYEANYQNIENPDLIKSGMKIIIPVLNNDVQLKNNKYIVKKGETLWDIAQKITGSGTNWSKIVEANSHRILSIDLIYPGQILDIPTSYSP